MITKTRKQGNSIMLTVPKDFNIPSGVAVEPKLVGNGILYEFVEPAKDFFDFGEEILTDIIAEGYEHEDILAAFKERKEKIVASFHTIAEEAYTDARPVTKEALEAELDL
ncbi:AbrB/MazE/SpoVT family DNA-binding domain-containing protein [Enterococcus sp. RIT-PI-f]|uniref:AbrB/MazE/SpoVT family DNA-binding domain-containing protein n=1 Tax=Enterococcus sp. RIT-PI-f TaxID=1690244 RepID=UPI0006B8DE49|nr:AbrB family transcriptional regulator [Enterococcus sp. RIT-PI-f]KPG70591.1 AbrB family transcriptional regulator [Enterococcus sp. RIT-PI-f]